MSISIDSCEVEVDGAAASVAVAAAASAAAAFAATACLTRSMNLYALSPGAKGFRKAGPT